jgi:hypothetical protein
MTDVSLVFRAARAVCACVVAFALVVACGGNGAESTGTGTTCTAASECYPNITGIRGTVSCLTQVPNGYCTHSCSSDGDCCHAKGECADNNAHPEVCAPLENMGATNCFLSCEDSVLNGMDGNTYCQQFANQAFTCRSTGGGHNNRKVCLP